MVSQPLTLPTLWSVVTMQGAPLCLSFCFLGGSGVPSVALSPLHTGADGRDRTSSSNSITWYAGVAGSPMLVTLSEDWIRNTAVWDSSTETETANQTYRLPFSVAGGCCPAPVGGPGRGERRDQPGATLGAETSGLHHPQ